MSKKSNRMYKDFVSWNSFWGCEFSCSYCQYRILARRQVKNCELCADFIPHFHENWLKKTYPSKKLFVCSSSDVSFCKPENFIKILRQIRRRPEKLYYTQSKRPEYFSQFETFYTGSMMLGITLETNRNAGYAEISNAPLPVERVEQFLKVNHPRKFVTIEPILNFDLPELVAMIRELRPETVWIGYDSRKGKPKLPEPELEKVMTLAEELKTFCHDVKLKTMR